MVKIKKTENPRAGIDVEQPELSYAAGGENVENFVFPAECKTYTQEMKQSSVF